MKISEIVLLKIFDYNYDVGICQTTIADFVLQKYLMTYTHKHKHTF